MKLEPKSSLPMFPTKPDQSRPKLLPFIYLFFFWVKNFFFCDDLTGLGLLNRSRPDLENWRVRYDGPGQKLGPNYWKKGAQS